MDTTMWMTLAAVAGGLGIALAGVQSNGDGPGPAARFGGENGGGENGGGENGGGGQDRPLRVMAFTGLPEAGHLVPVLELVSGLKEQAAAGRTGPVEVTLVFCEDNTAGKVGAFARSFGGLGDDELVCGGVGYDAASWTLEDSSRPWFVKRVVEWINPTTNTLFKMLTVGERVGMCNAASYAAAKAHVETSGIVPDVVVYETFAGWGADLAVEWGVPAVMVQSSALMLPTDPVTGPGRMSGDPARTTSLGKRLKRLVASAVLPFLRGPLMYGAQVTLRQRAGVPGPLIMPLDAMNQHGHVILATMAPPLDYARALHPNVVNVGPLGPQTTKPCSDAVADWLAAREPGSVVYVAMGSHLGLPPVLARNLVAAVRQVVTEDEAVHVLWARAHTVAEADPELATLLDHPQIYGAGFVAQTAVLRSPAVGLFVSHMGAGSMGQGAAAGVPFVSIPLGLDQPYNSARAAEAGLTVVLDKHTATVDEIAAAIQSGPSRRAAAARVKAMLDGHGGSSRAAAVVHAVARAGGWGLSVPYNSRWTWVARNNIDVLALVAGLAAGAAYGAWLAARSFQLV